MRKLNAAPHGSMHASFCSCYKWQTFHSTIYHYFRHESVPHLMVNLPELYVFTNIHMCEYGCVWVFEGGKCVSEVCPVLEAEINMKRDVIFKQIHLQAAERHVCPAGVCMCVFRKSLCSHYLTSLQKASVNKCTLTHMHTHVSVHLC